MKIEQETNLAGGVQDTEIKRAIRDILRNDIRIQIDTSVKGDRSLSQPIQDAFESNGCRTEVSPQSLPNKIGRAHV